ncbi:alpha/beta fold hydrolase [Kineococcus esterisolvens]|uniref:alpha/beta fold hydrolase n=1 Tax=unclassified Kineococcus TaxID=2621656 RepID=UPI003D7E4E20
MESYHRDGLVFDVRDHAPGGTAQGVVVCLHGFPQDAHAWDAVAPRLTAAGLRVLAPDQRGYSPGARPGGRAAYVLPELVADVLALADAAGAGTFHVVGHDWGGVVAWALAAGHPERVASATVLSTPHPAAMRAAALRGTQALRSAYAVGFQLPALPERVLLARSGAVLRALLVRGGLPDALAAGYARRMAEPGALSAALGWYRALPLRRGGTGPARVPVTFLHGRHDPFFAPAAVRATASHVRGEFSGAGLPAGHWLPEREPVAVADAVLERVRRAA